MNNHDCFAEAFRERGGETLSTSEIAGVLLARFPEFSPGSVLPNDHAEGNKAACWCAGTDQRIFDRVGRGRYRVQPANPARKPREQEMAPSGSGAQPRLSKVAPQSVNMIDPLTSFDWTTLYSRYKAKCRNFHPNSQHLKGIQPTPMTDLCLYYRLLAQAVPERRSHLTVDWYEALVYWKLYSQYPSGSISWLREVPPDRLRYLLSVLPVSIRREVAEVVRLVELIDEYRLPGMVSGLPVRTTFLHFLYPDVVPVFDQMVLKAVGAWQERANQSIDVLRQYIPHAWVLADRHTRSLAGFDEVPLRLVDMALWVKRG